ncbi:MAG: branched-chain amino acid ABC transporter permease [Candidatus Dormibacteraeota bacterium]|uniref:Branched-chain amino acid ABC transporter permease n=1 Tax=Candidatus Amunia macphersoniae TaxID=3127014 RepID=A0A934KEY0_9BACT|nr:branched-chain amino acid ABC transporter permease [Candidatus Dormibacteraeota bacterium]
MAVSTSPQPSRISRPSPGTVAIVLLLLAACTLPFVLDAFWLSTADFILIAAIGALGLNVLTGYTGQVSLGHAFFLGIGAYTAAFLADHGVNAALWIPGAGVAAGLVGLLVGPTALRLRGLYLAIVTIGLVFLGTHLFVNIPAITGGPAGRATPQPMWGPADFGGNGLTIAGVSFDRNGCYYFLALTLLALSMWFVHNLMRTRSGRAMQAVRDREIAAALMGVNLARTKLAAFVVSSFLAGLCGALYGAFLFHVDPSQWGLLLSIQFVAIIIVGGIGTVWGALLGSVFITGLPTLLIHYSDSVPFLQHSAGQGGIAVSDATNLLYGLLIVVFLVVEPRGLIGLVARAAGSITHRRRTAAVAVHPSPLVEE